MGPHQHRGDVLVIHQEERDHAAGHDPAVDIAAEGEELLALALAEELGAHLLEHPRGRVLAPVHRCGQVRRVPAGEGVRV
jgi:hypothetical protein